MFGDFSTRLCAWHSGLCPFSQFAGQPTCDSVNTRSEVLGIPSLARGWRDSFVLARFLVGLPQGFDVVAKRRVPHGGAMIFRNPRQERVEALIGRTSAGGPRALAPLLVLLAQLLPASSRAE